MLKFLGSGGAFHTELGNTSAYMEIQDELILFDAGEDVFPKLIKLGLLENKSRINIFLTHLHSDHVGSLGTMIAYLYFKVFGQDSSNICVYFPSETICELLALQGVPKAWYNFFMNKWDELYIPGLKKQPEYSFYENVHTELLAHNGQTNSYSIEFIIENEGSFFYSGDTNQIHSKLENFYQYDYIYHEVTSVPNTGVHLHYDDLVAYANMQPEEFRNRIYLMHLDQGFNQNKAIEDGFHIVKNVEEK